jgi:hypothetical protein
VPANEETPNTQFDLPLAVEVDSAGLSTDVEREAPGDEEIRTPFDPEKIDVATRNPTIDLLLARLRRGSLDIEPDFQRLAGIWTLGAQSRLIDVLRGGAR